MGRSLKMTQLSRSENREDQFAALLFWVFFNFKMKQPLNSCEMRCTSLASSNMSVWDSAKGAVNVTSSVQASFQSLKIYSVVVLLLL